MSAGGVEPITPSPLIRVGWAPAGDPGAVARAAGAPVSAVGVPVVSTSTGPVVAPGVPGRVSVGEGGAVVVTALDPAAARRAGFTGKMGETLRVGGADGDTPTVVFVGCGPAPGATDGVVPGGVPSSGAPSSGALAGGGAAAGGVDPLRRAAAAVARAAGQDGSAVFVLPASLAGVGASQRRAIQAVAEGAVLATYRFVAHKSETEGGRIESFVVAGADLDDDAMAEGAGRGAAVAGAVCLARDLVNEPPSSMTPSRLAAAAAELVGGRPGVTVEVWDEDRIATERLGGLLGVARGSAEPPRLVRGSYEPADPVEIDGRVPHVAIVGKGITFDSGGLSLKSADGMVTMKTDMSGAAAVLATLSACADAGVRVRVTAIAPMTENMPGGRATKPGDVLTIRNGHTIEVLNTDAEGRLVLADGLTLAIEEQPDAVIDLATLTGACVVALGDSIAGVFGSDDELVDRVRAASERAGEPMWPLPLFDGYRSHIDSEVADMKNIGKAGQAGAISAALLLARFVEGTPWVHLDIAGPARSDDDAGVLVKGGTGFGVRTLLEVLESYGAPGE